MKIYFNKRRLVVACCIVFLIVLNAGVFSPQAKPFIGPTERMEAEIIERCGVDSSRPDTPTSTLGVASDGEYVFVKIDLSKLPPIDEIFLVSAYLKFTFSDWSASGEWGYASVASHYCEDDSWASPTLTWNNKPSFRPEATAYWGFGIIYFGDELGFDVSEDVVDTLESGDKLLTEVITWGSGKGHTKLSNPELTIVYAKKPVYELLLGAVCDVPGAEIAELVRISLGDQVLGEGPPAVPMSEYVSPGTFNLGFLGGCKFSGWQVSGGVSVSNSDEPFTQIKIDYDGGLTAKCSLDWIIYGYDEEPRSIYEGVAFNPSESYAERCWPIVSGYIRLVRVYIIENSAQFELRILGLSGDLTEKAPVDIANPVTITPSDKGWVEIDLTSQKIRVERGTPYYISITWLSNEKPVLAETSIIVRKPYSFKNNIWKDYSHPLSIQHIVSTSLEEPVKFTETPPTPTSPSPVPSPSPFTPIESYGIPLIIFGLVAAVIVVFFVRRRWKSSKQPEELEHTLMANTIL